MNDYTTMPQDAHRLELVGRERLTISGVEDVERFDETGIVMSTSAGTLVVTGEDLHIGKLSLDGGELHVDGRIDSVSYEDQGQGWRTRSPNSCWCLSSPSCWACPPDCCMICCVPFASGSPASPGRWTACTVWPWAPPPSGSSCAGLRGKCGALFCWAALAGQCCSSAHSLRFCGPSGSFGRIRWPIWSICCLSLFSGPKIFSKNVGCAEKISFILRGNAIQ